MKTKMTLSLAALALNAFSGFPQAHATEGVEGHGGDVVFCPGEEAKMLDFYEASLPTNHGQPADIIPVNQMSRNEVYDYLFSNLKKALEQAGIDQFNRLNERPGPKLKYPFDCTTGYYKLKKAEEDFYGRFSDWAEAELPQGNDQELGYNLPSGCYLKRAASRQISTYKIFVDRSVTQYLSEGQIAVLEFHEIFRGYFGASSVNIRALISELLKNKVNASRVMQFGKFSCSRG